MAGGTPSAWRRVAGMAAGMAVAIGISVPMLSSVSQAAGNIDLGQCRNGGVGQTPVACDNAAGTYQNGDLNYTNSHYREGDFVPFRSIISGLSAGTHVLDFGYQVADQGSHAYDYLGSFDATETTSPTPSALFANNNNPCDGLDIGTGAPCDPDHPTSTVGVTAPDFAGVDAACGTSGTFPAQAQVSGTIDLFGPMGSTIGDFGYDAPQFVQLAPHGSGCETFVHVTITLPAALAAGQSIVVAWGGHLASQADWGVGNGASDISGAPFHMLLNTLDGQSVGERQRSIHTSAIFFAPSVTTQIYNSSTNQVVTSVVAGTVVHDQAIMTGANAGATSSLTYNLYSTGNCMGPVLQSWTVSTTGNTVPPSGDFTTPLDGGAFSFQAVFPGGTHHNLSATGPCEPLGVNLPQPRATTTVDDSAGMPIHNPIPLGTSVYDTTTLTGGASPTGTVIYTFFTGSDTCTPGTGVTTTTQTVTIANGAVPPTSTVGPLAAGRYSYQATYNGDPDNLAATAACEPVDVSTGAATVTTTVDDAATTPVSVWRSPEPLGAGAEDTATLSVTPTPPPFPLTGQLNYYLFTDAAGSSGCTGTPVLFDTVTVGADGTVPNSKSTGPLAGGNYGFEAQYTGNANYGASPMGDCEPFSVGTVQLSLRTTVNDGTAAAGATVTDSAALMDQVADIPATGTVTYALYSGECTPTPSGQLYAGTGAGTNPDPVFVLANPAGSVPDSASFGPLPAGDYYFLVTYTPNGSSYTAGAADCEPFTLSAVTSSTTTGSGTTSTAANGPVTGASTTGSSTSSAVSAKPAAAATSSGGAIAFTGAYLDRLALLAALLLAVGAGLLVMARRRRRAGREA